MKKCIIIMNPESGKKKKITTYQEFYDILRKYGYEADIIFTERKGHANRIIQDLDDNIDLVISAGGDGTLNEIVSGNLAREKKLIVAPLPLGSTNDVGHMYGLDKSVFENLESLLKGKVKKVDICYINEVPFVYVACLGDYIDMAYNTPRDLKRKYGKIAYILYGIKHIRKKLHKYNIKYIIDRKEYNGVSSFIFISNSSRIAGQPDIYYDVKLDDNKFEVVLANVNNRADILKLLLLASTMDIKDIPGVTYYRTNNIRIEFLKTPKASWCIDGEELKSSSNIFFFTVDQKMKMLVPKENLKDLFEE